MEEIQAVIKFDNEQASHRYSDLFKPGIAYRVFLGVFLQIWQQLTGMNIIMFYVVFLFQQAGIGDSQESTLIASGVSYVLNVVMTVPAILFVDKWGRRPTMIFGALAMSAFLWIVGGLLTTGDWYIQNDPNQANYGKWAVTLPKTTTNAVVTFVYLFVCSFATTWGPVSLERRRTQAVMDAEANRRVLKLLVRLDLPSRNVSELYNVSPSRRMAFNFLHLIRSYPLRVRAMAVSLSTAANWFFNWLLSFTVPMMMENLRFGLYLLFAGFNLLMAIHVWAAYP